MAVFEGLFVALSLTTFAAGTAFCMGFCWRLGTIASQRTVDEWAPAGLRWLNRRRGIPEFDPGRAEVTHLVIQEEAGA